jgi:hypothetical protein
MKIGMFRGLALTAIAVLFCAGFALAAKPTRGAAYKGEFKGTPGTVTQISFDVSASGKRISDLYTETPFKCSGGCGGTPSGTGGSGKISKRGTFTVKIKLTGPGSTKAIGTDTVVGRFLSHGRAKGTVTSHFNHSSVGEKISWTATG